MLKFVLQICAIFCAFNVALGAPAPSTGSTEGLVPLTDGRRAVTHYWVSTFTATWTNAEKYCRSSGRRLLSIQDDVEQREVEAYLATSNFGDGPSYWISLNDIITEGHFTWFSTGEDLLWPNWAKGPCGADDEAGNTVGNDCGSIDTDLNSSYGWRVNACADLKPFICEDL